MTCGPAQRRGVIPATVLHTSHAVPTTDICVVDALSGTESGYAATRCTTSRLVECAEAKEDALCAYSNQSRAW